MKRRSFLLALATAAAPAALALPASADSLDEALGRVSASRAKLKTLRGAFRQKRIIGLLATEVDSKGRLLLARPNRLRWELYPPDEVTYWVGPEGFAMSTADGVNRVGKAAAGRFAAVLSDLMVLLGGDLRQLKARYQLRVEEPSGRFALTARPLSKKNAPVAKHVSSLRMETGPELWTVKRIVIEEKNGDQSIIVFDKLERDRPIDPALVKPPRK
ncbi:MAG: outer membrane lipoprotein carrier protein LolA [Deltaproteobacteria bacterium]|jgi:outer membrane lipoprotein-sorting protein|nr:outer membrane lipoprotein carrier protein LolA [Deltaproteobacteria bacterium]MBW2531052.1 outer membrane lipoprotein carrier protein LolA [Deltaproteobacteria bacterium]